jgi:hypothetical protein
MSLDEAVASEKTETKAAGGSKTDEAEPTAPAVSSVVMCYG